MSATANMVRIVRVRVTEGNTGLFYAESPDLRGLLVAEPDMTTLWESVPNAIRDLYRASGLDVIVARAMDAEPDMYPFAAIPEALMTSRGTHTAEGASHY